ncbi:MAG: hypothetical protein EPO21_10320 [Chloroflexota bacterium]|nr:MAG: hypothetical protein EPO21_10320 [Chloroflexota bacterium]
MITNIYEVDAFTGRRGKLVMTIESDYRFEKGDEFVIDQGGGHLALRVMKVRMILQPDEIRREIDAIHL